MEAFARALRQLPTIIADNAGLDSSELVTQVAKYTIYIHYSYIHTLAMRFLYDTIV